MGETKMKRHFLAVGLLLVLALFAGVSSTSGRQGAGDGVAAPQAPAAVEGEVASTISYQGSLRENGAPVAGSRNMLFEFWDNNSCIGSAPVISIEKENVPVSDGRFSVTLAVPPARFTGQAYWLKVTVNGTALGCQELLPTAYALSLRPGATIAAGGTALTLSSSSGNALVATTGATSGGQAGVALIGRNTATSGGKAGVLGENASRSDWNIGVWGLATANSGVTSGVWGQTESTTDGARGVTGWAHGQSGATYGVRGDSQSPAGTGVGGYANALTGHTYGVYGQTSSTSDWTVAVWGHAVGASGVTTGAWGTTDSSTDGARGLMGMATATSGKTYGVVGENQSPSGWAAKFESAGYGVWIETELEGVQALGVHNGDVGIDLGELWVGGDVHFAGDLHLKGRIIYDGVLPPGSSADTEGGNETTDAEEPAEVWLTGYGFGVMTGDVAQITIDPTFAQTVNLTEPYHVFVQVYGDAEVFVTDRTPTGFTVRLREGDPDIEFSYSIVAKRLGFEGERLESPPPAP